MQKYQPNGVNGENMADKLGLGPEVRELKLGPSFTNNKGTSFHTIRYDFKPASVDENKVATVDMGANNQVTVTVPHLDGAGTPQTVFKGCQRGYQKECVLIIDRATGEITLEKLSTAIQLKKTRMEPPQRLAPPPAPGPQSSRPITPVDAPQPPPPAPNKKLPSPQHRSAKNSKKTSPKSATLAAGCIPKHSPLHASPSYPTTRSPNRPEKQLPPLPPQQQQHQHQHHRSSPGSMVAASLPVIGLDDGMDLGFGAPTVDAPPLPPPPPPRVSPDYGRTREEEETEEATPVGILSESSSDSSSDSGSSDSESEPDSRPPPIHNSTMNNVNGHANGTTVSSALSMPDQLLRVDLQLSSESGSDSD